MGHHIEMFVLLWKQDAALSPGQKLELEVKYQKMTAV